MPDVNQIAERMRAEHGAPTGGLTLLEEFDAHGAHCQVFLRGLWTLAAFEWHATFANGEWDSGEANSRGGPNGAGAMAENAARLRWNAERDRQRQWVLGQSEGQTVET